MNQVKILFSIWLGKAVAKASRLFNLGRGSTWPGHLALKFSPRIILILSSQIKKGIIVVAGTNGKTTTAKMIRTILEPGIRSVKAGPASGENQESRRAVHNEAGANLLNGIASSLINTVDWWGKLNADFAIFEIDENTLPLVLKEITPKMVVVLNLFRDQLDRYGEVDLIAERWQKALLSLPLTSQVILNGDDPQVALLGKDLKARVAYFGLNDPKVFLKEKQHAMDVVYCPNCGQKLEFTGVYFSHLGEWKCPKCKAGHPKLDSTKWNYPLLGIYNRYNTLAAVLVAQKLGVNKEQIEKALSDFQPAFGRQEEFLKDGKKIKILLSKNPTGFNESIRTVNEDKQKKVILLVLNDRIPDGRDVSWIWDVDFEELSSTRSLIVSGDRAFDMGLRLKYASSSKMENANLKFKIIEDLREAINQAIDETPSGGGLYVLPTYSAMLEVRKILTGKELL